MGGALDQIALGVGWVVLVCTFVVALSAAWWGCGHLIWGALPEPWRQAQLLPVPQPRYGDYIPPAASSKAICLMVLRGGPYGLTRLPGVLSANRKKHAILKEKETGSDPS
jgi:hypothetical protein